MKNIVILIFIISMIIALIRFSSLLIRFPGEVYYAITISKDNKKIKLYGNEYTTIKKIDAFTNKESIIIYFGNNGKLYYLGRYLLYPKKFIWYKNLNNISLTANNDSQYIFSENPQEKINKFNLESVATDVNFHLYRVI